MVSIRWGRVWLQTSLTNDPWVTRTLWFPIRWRKHTQHCLLLNATKSSGPNAWSSLAIWGLWKVNVSRWMGKGNQDPKYHWNNHDFLFLFFLWHLLGWSQRLPETQNCVPSVNKKSSQEFLFLVCKDRRGEGGLLDQKEHREIPLWFCNTLFFVFPSCHSSAIAVVVTRQVPKLQGRRGTLFWPEELWS